LSHHQVEHPRVAEVSRDDAPTVTVAVSSTQMADVEEFAAADIQVDSIPLERTQVVPL
jgi:hypothetical protein